jgi:hypothetical protein
LNYLERRPAVGTLHIPHTNIRIHNDPGVEHGLQSEEYGLAGTFAEDSQEMGLYILSIHDPSEVLRVYVVTGFGGNWDAALADIIDLPGADMGMSSCRSTTSTMGITAATNYLTQFNRVRWLVCLSKKHWGNWPIPS